MPVEDIGNLSDVFKSDVFNLSIEKAENCIKSAQNLTLIWREIPHFYKWRDESPFFVDNMKTFCVKSVH